MIAKPLSPHPKHVKGFGNHTFEGEGDVCLNKSGQGNVQSPKHQYCSNPIA
jgi:hypothetical protein